MHVPPSFPVGMDIHEMGPYSPEDNVESQDFANKVLSALALEWVQRVNKEAEREDLKTEKVGEFDAFSTQIPDHQARLSEHVVIKSSQQLTTAHDYLASFLGSRAPSSNTTTRSGHRSAASFKSKS